MKSSEILKEAKAKVAVAEAWTQGEYAREKDGYALMLEYPEEKQIATCYCTLGAVRAVTEKDSWNDPHRIGPASVINYLVDSVAATVFREDYHHANVAAFNDNKSTTHADIIALFDRAIAAAEAAGD